MFADLLGAAGVGPLPGLVIAEARGEEEGRATPGSL